MFEIQTLEQAGEVVSQCLHYLSERSSSPESVDSIDIIIVLGRVGVLGDADAIPRLREKLKLHQWMRVSTSLKQLTVRLQQEFGRNSTDQSWTPDRETVFTNTVLLLETLANHCSRLSVEQRRATTRKNTRRYRERLQLK